MWFIVLKSDFHHLWASNTSLSIDFHFKVIHYSNSGEFYILSPLNSSHKTPNVCWIWLQSKGSFGILCGREVSAVGGTCRVAFVCRIAVFFSCEELAAAGEERHGSCNALPSHRKHELFLLPIKPLNPPVLHCFIPRTHTHTHITPLALIVVWKPPSNPQPLFSSQKKRDFFLVVLASTLSVVHRVQQTHHQSCGTTGGLEWPWQSATPQLTASCFCLFVVWFLSLPSINPPLCACPPQCSQHPPLPVFQAAIAKKKPLMAFCKTLIWAPK